MGNNVFKEGYHKNGDYVQLSLWRPPNRDRGFFSRRSHYRGSGCCGCDDECCCCTGFYYPKYYSELGRVGIQGEGQFHDLWKPFAVKAARLRTALVWTIILSFASFFFGAMLVSATKASGALALLFVFVGPVLADLLLLMFYLNFRSQSRADISNLCTERNRFGGLWRFESILGGRRRRGRAGCECCECDTRWYIRVYLSEVPTAVVQQQFVIPQAQPAAQVQPAIQFAQPVQPPAGQGQTMTVYAVYNPHGPTNVVCPSCQTQIGLPGGFVSGNPVYCPSGHSCAVILQMPQ